MGQTTPGPETIALGETVTIDRPLTLLVPVAVEHDDHGQAWARPAPTNGSGDLTVPRRHRRLRRAARRHRAPSRRGTRHPEVPLVSAPLLRPRAGRRAQHADAAGQGRARLPRPHAARVGDGARRSVRRRAFVSVRADQAQDPVRAAFPQIVDSRDDLGPIAGIIAAQDAQPDAAWLVLACDLPFLDAATLDHLLGARRSGRGRPRPTGRATTASPSPSARSTSRPAGPRSPPTSRAGRAAPAGSSSASDAHLIDQPDPGPSTT